MSVQSEATLLSLHDYLCAQDTPAGSSSNLLQIYSPELSGKIDFNASFSPQDVKEETEDDPEEERVNTLLSSFTASPPQKSLVKPSLSNLVAELNPTSSRSTTYSSYKTLQSVNKQLALQMVSPLPLVTSKLPLERVTEVVQQLLRKLEIQKQSQQEAKREETAKARQILDLKRELSEMRHDRSDRKDKVSQRRPSKLKMLRESDYLTNKEIDGLKRVNTLLEKKVSMLSNELKKKEQELNFVKVQLLKTENRRLSYANSKGGLTMRSAFYRPQEIGDGIKEFKKFVEENYDLKKRQLVAQNQQLKQLVIRFHSAWREFVKQGCSDAKTELKRRKAAALFPPQLLQLNEMSLRMPYHEIQSEFQQIQEQNAQRLRCYINAGLTFPEVVELCSSIALLNKPFAERLKRIKTFSQFKKALVTYVKEARNQVQQYTNLLRTTPIRETRSFITSRSFLGDLSGTSSSSHIRDNNSPMLILHQQSPLKEGIKRFVAKRKAHKMSRTAQRSRDFTESNTYIFTDSDE